MKILSKRTKIYWGLFKLTNNNLAKIKDGENVINLVGYKSTGTH